MRLVRPLTPGALAEVVLAEVRVWTRAFGDEAARGEGDPACDLRM